MNLNLRQRYHNFIRRWVMRDPIRFQTLRADLTAARFGVTVEHYLGSAIFFSLFAGIITAAIAYPASQFVVTPQVQTGIYNIFSLQIPEGVSLESLLTTYRAVASLIVFVLASLLAYSAILKYPSIEKGNRKTKINLTLHNAVSYMYAMRRGGAMLMTIFRSISENAGVYGEIALEFRQVVRDADYFGHDVVSALRNLSETTPSEKFKDFLEDLLSVIESGGDMSNFLSGRVRLYQEEAKFEQRQFLTTLQLVAEAYVTVFVAGPLFLIIIMVVMGMIGSSAVVQLSLVAYVLIPIGSLIFIVFIDLISIKSEIVERYKKGTILKEFSDVLRYEREGEEPLFKQLEKYDRYRKVREFIRHPLQTFIVNFNRTFLITIPIAIIYVLYVVMSVPEYIVVNTELYIDVIDDHFIFATLIILIPFGFFYEMWRRKIFGIEASLPDFLDRLSGINQVGLTLAQAISIMVKANLGVLTYEIKRIKRDIDWGASINDALVRFEERIRTQMIARTVTLITKASQMSGEIGEVLSIAASDANMSEVLKRERLSEMFIYTAIIYLAFFVFIFVIIVMNGQFLSVLEEVNVEGLGSSGFFSAGAAPVETIKRLLYHTCLLQAFFSGLIAGEMGEASIRAGVKHSAIMVIIAVIAFAVFL